MWGGVRVRASEVVGVHDGAQPVSQPEGGGLRCATEWCKRVGQLVDEVAEAVVVPRDQLVELVVHAVVPETGEAVPAVGELLPKSESEEELAR